MDYLSTELAKQIWKNKYQFNNETLERWFDRVSGNNPEIKKLIKEKKFIFGGRILANRGTGNGSLSNCYSLGYVKDSLKSIMDANTKLALTFKAQGGQGLSLSLIRPRGTKVGTDFTSDGIIPFMEIFNKTTESISQGSGRRGALLMSLDITHKEASEFISIKSDLGKINNANLSLEIDDMFMSAVQKYYDTGEVISYDIVKEYDSEEIRYEITPIKLFKKMTEYAWKYAEPGVLFTDRFRNYNLNEYDPDYKIVTGNPCGEQPLISGGACCLSAINLSKYVIYPFTRDARFEYSKLKEDLWHIYCAMDDIVSEGLDFHALEEQKEVASKYRNIGISPIGWADLFIKFECPYGSEKSKELAKDISRFLFNTCLEYNIKLGITRGSFPGMKAPFVYDNVSIINNNSDNGTYESGKITHLRNCSMLTIAPTGTISNLLECSSGIEPNFALKYTRKTKSLNGGEDTEYVVLAPIVKEYLELHPDETADELPWYFTSAYDIDPKSRIDIQAIIQNSIDTAISSTVNLPAETTKEEVEKLYLYAWERGLKGVTCYREGSRDPILYVNKQEEKYNSGVTKRPKEIRSILYKTKVKNEEFAVIVGFVDDKPYETFAMKLATDNSIKQCEGKTIKVCKGTYKFVSDNLTLDNLELSSSLIEERAVTLCTSMLLRHHADINFIIKTIKKINPIVSSFTSAICRILAKYANTMNDSEDVKVCPNCGSKIIKENGCEHCSNCDYSLCNLLIRKH